MCDRLESLVCECVEHSHRMLIWARKSATENRGFNKIDPMFELLPLQDLVSEARPLFPDYESDLARLSHAGAGVEAFFGITGTSYHDTGLKLADKVLEQVADATGSLLFDGPYGDGLWRVYIAALSDFDLEQTDLRDRLKRIELSDHVRLQILIKKEALSLHCVVEEMPLVSSEPRASVTVAHEALASLETETPAFSSDSGLWVRNKRAAELDGVETETLRTYRYAGSKNTEGTFGRDSDGRVWRRPGTPNSHPWYLRSTLRSEQQNRR